MFGGRLASTPPSIVSGAFALVAFATYLTPSEGVPPLFIIGLWAALSVLSVLWSLDLYVLSTVVQEKQPSVWLMALYCTAALAAAVVLPLSLTRPTDERLALGSMATIVLLLVVMWRASAALVAAEADEGKVGSLVTFLQIIYLVIGVWFLCSRVERLLKRRDAQAHGA